MNLDDLPRVKRLADALAEAETKLAHFSNVEKLHIQSGCCMELQDYPDPSRIGFAFRTIRAALVALCENHVAELKADLAKIGVDT